MRCGLAGAVFLLALAFAVDAAQPRPVVSPTRAQLQLMPLPRAVYGALVASLEPGSSSGWTTNAKAAENDLDPTTTAAELTRMGRVTSFDVDFSDLSKVSQHGVLIDADSEVALYRSAAAATRSIARDRTNLGRFAGKQGRGGEVFDHVSFFGTSGYPGALGARLRFQVGAIVAWETQIEFRVGSLVASVGLGRTDDRDVHANVLRLASPLRARIHGVLAGKVHDKPLPKPIAKLGGLGRPPGGPDLSHMAVEPIDLTPASKPRHEGYVRNQDDVAAYSREYGLVTFGATRLTLLRLSVELRPTAKAAADQLSLFKAALRTAAGRKLFDQGLAASVPPQDRQGVRFSPVETIAVSAGDGAYAFTTSARFAKFRLSAVYCLVQRGPVLEALLLYGFPNETIHRLDTVRMARTVASRIDQALH